MGSESETSNETLLDPCNFAGIGIDQNFVGKSEWLRTRTRKLIKTTCFCVGNSTSESDESSKDTDSSENTQAKSKKRKGNDFFYLKKKRRIRT